MSHHILDFFHNNFFLVTLMALLVKTFGLPVKRPSEKYIPLPPTPSPFRFIILNVGANAQSVLGHANSDILKMYL